MEILGLKTPKWEKKVFYHFCVVSGWTCPYTQALLCMHIWKKVSDKYQNVSLLMSSRAALCSHSTMMEGSLCSPSSSKMWLEPCDKSWGLYQQSIPPHPPLPSDSLVLFPIPMGRESSEHQPPRLRGMLQGYSSIRKVTIIFWVQYRYGTLNVDGHFPGFLLIFVIFQYLSAKARFIFLFYSTWMTN